MNLSFVHQTFTNQLWNQRYKAPNKKYFEALSLLASSRRHICVRAAETNLPVITYKQVGVFLRCFAVEANSVPMNVQPNTQAARTSRRFLRKTWQGCISLRSC